MERKVKKIVVKQAQVPTEKDSARNCPCADKPANSIIDSLFNKVRKRFTHKASIRPEQNSLQLYLTGFFSHIILWIVLSFILIFIIWASFANIDEVTRANGKVIPSRKTQVIQNLEGGIVKTILVHEGEIVNKNQLLMQIDNTKFSSEYKSGRLHAESLAMKIARLNAELKGIDFKPKSRWIKELPDLISTEQQLYHSRQSELKSLLSHRSLLRREIEMTKPLLKSGAASEVELLRMEQRYHDITRHINNFKSVSIKELNEAKSLQARITENNIALKYRLNRTDILSPVKGIVKQIYVSTLGGVIRPGMALMEVVPLEDTLLIEAQVKPNNIGFLHTGQEVTVKVSAYDYSIYGGIPGKIEHISADTTMDPKGNNFDESWVRTQRNYLRKNEKELRIIPGMQVSVDVLTGRKTVMDYLLKPILKAKYNALRER